MKIFVLKLTCIILPFFFLVTITNYIVDPANIFSARKYVAGVADILSKGHNVDNIANYDERLLQEQMVERLPKSPDIVVIGSSRIMEIGSDFFPGKLVLNCGVSHANIHDLIAIVGLLDSFNRIPNQMIINLDPDIVGQGGTLEWQSLMPYHESFWEKRPGGNLMENNHFESYELKKLYALFSFDYFSQSLAFILKGAAKTYSDVQHLRPKEYGRFSDGTISYSFKHMNPDSSQVALDAKITGSRNGIPSLDPEKLELLNLLLNFLQSKKVKIEFLMLPFHKEYYTAVNASHKNLFYTYDSLFRSLAKIRQIPIYGSFDPAMYHIGQSQFYDMYHCSKDAIKKVYVN
jgi:hypothetical protein